MSDFVLDDRLAADTQFVADWDLSRVLLMNDARFPWLILVPRRVGLREIHQLTEADAATLIGELRHASATLQAMTQAQKINVGALGNMVPQLHVHVVARNEGDAAWPGPVWGSKPRMAYTAEAGAALIERLRKSF